MTRYALDPATLLLLVEDGIVVGSEHRLVAPRSLRTAALQLLLDDVRAGRRTEKEALALHVGITELKYSAYGDRVSRRTAWEIAQQTGADLRVGEYLAVAKLQGDVLVTVDPELVRLAAGIVEVADPSVLT